jgi:hypothetical protein
MDSTMNPKTDADTVTKTFKVKFEWDVWMYHKNRILYLDNSLEDKIIPYAEAKAEKKDNWRCTYCDHALLCSLLKMDQVQLSDPEAFFEEYKTMNEVLNDPSILLDELKLLIERYQIVGQELGEA